MIHFSQVWRISVDSERFTIREEDWVDGRYTLTMLCTFSGMVIINIGGQECDGFLWEDGERIERTIYSDNILKMLAESQSKFMRRIVKMQGDKEWNPTIADV